MKINNGVKEYQVNFLGATPCSLRWNYHKENVRKLEIEEFMVISC